MRLPSFGLGSVLSMLYISPNGPIGLYYHPPFADEKCHIPKAVVISELIFDSGLSDPSSFI